MRFTLLLLLSSLCLTASAQKSSCDDMGQGLFYYYSDSSADYVFIREEGFQKEINLLTGDTSLWAMEWKNNCTYTLSHVSGGPYDAMKKASGKNLVMAVKIQQTTPAYYTYTAYADKIGGRAAATDTVWRQEQTRNRPNKVLVDGSFPGGASAWSAYLSEVLSKEEKSLQRLKKTTTCYIGFVIDVDGSVSNIEVLNKMQNVLTRVSIKAIKEGPKWIPATVNGTPVKTLRIQPVTYQISK